MKSKYDKIILPLFDKYKTQSFIQISRAKTHGRVIKIQKKQLII